MSNGWKDTVSRRPLLAALAAIAGIGAAGTLLYEGAQLHGRLLSGPYGDLFSDMGDSESAAAVGRAVLAQTPSFDPQRTAQNLRGVIEHRPLAAVLSGEAAQGEVMEIHGWVLPASLAWLCALAATKS